MRRAMLGLYFVVIAISGLPFARSIWLGAVAAEHPPVVASGAPCDRQAQLLFDELWEVYSSDVRQPADARVPFANASPYVLFDSRIAGALQECGAVREQLEALVQLRHALATTAGLLRATHGDVFSKVLRP